LLLNIERTLTKCTTDFDKRGHIRVKIYKKLHLERK